MVTSVPWWQLASSEALNERIRQRTEQAPTTRGRTTGMQIPTVNSTDHSTWHPENLGDG